MRPSTRAKGRTTSQPTKNAQQATPSSTRPQRNIKSRSAAAAPKGTTKKRALPAGVDVPEAGSSKKARIVAGARRNETKPRSKGKGKAPQSGPRRFKPVVIPSESEGEHDDEESQASNNVDTDIDAERDDDLDGADADQIRHAIKDEACNWGQDSDHDAEDNKDQPEHDSDGFYPGQDDEPVMEAKIESRRAAERRAEAPVWNDSDSETANFNNGNEDDDHVDEDDEGDDDLATPSPNLTAQMAAAAVNIGWTPEAHYLPPAAGARLIRVRDQPEALKAIIQSAIKSHIGNALAINAYPTAESLPASLRQTLVKAAQRLGHNKYAERFEKDIHFSAVIGRIVNGRLSTYRGNVKKCGSGKVEGFYALATGPACKTKIEALLKDTTYIYPLKEGTNNIISAKPFGHPAIVATVRDVFFTSSRGGSLAVRHHRRFTSSAATHPDELELPAAMLALVATCIHSALDDWSSGTCKKTEFNADLYEDIYLGHMTFLDQIKEASAAKYHRLMADLYTQASSTSPRRAAAVASSAMALLDLTAMAE